MCCIYSKNVCLLFRHGKYCSHNEKPILSLNNLFMLMFGFYSFFGIKFDMQKLSYMFCITVSSS
ncbi:hypothetical protein HanRHA438_Chr15g0691031 [Helianthus annuus]|nr:hypothetical protein HanRHA438_Chr15g0691031 [Helianthus annuus]